MRTVLRLLEEDHQDIADLTDIDLVGDTRYAAVWQLSGRAIGLGRGVVALLAQDFCAEVLALGRTLHECTRLIDAFEDPEDGEVGGALLRRWLKDEGKDYIKPWEARAAECRGDQRHREAMLKDGFAPIPESSGLSFEMYDHLSRTAHNRRRPIQEDVDPVCRTMIRGPHPDLRVVAHYVSYGGNLIEEMLLTVGHAFPRFTGGREYMIRRLFPLQNAFRDARSAAPLT